MDKGLMPKPLTWLLNYSRKYSLWMFQWGLACCAIEMAAALPFARLAEALAQPSGDLTDQTPHLFDLPRLDPGQRRVAQDLVAEVFGFFAAVQHQRLRDRFTNGAAQAVQRIRQPLRQCGVGGLEVVEVVAERVQFMGRSKSAAASAPGGVPEPVEAGAGEADDEVPF